MNVIYECAANVIAHEQQVENLKKQIDAALDERNEIRFMILTNTLKYIQKEFAK